ERRDDRVPLGAAPRLPRTGDLRSPRALRAGLDRTDPGPRTGRARAREHHSHVARRRRAGRRRDLLDQALADGGAGRWRLGPMATMGGSRARRLGVPRALARHGRAADRPRWIRRPFSAGARRHGLGIAIDAFVEPVPHHHGAPVAARSGERVVSGAGGPRERGHAARDRVDIGRAIRAAQRRERARAGMRRQRCYVPGPVARGDGDRGGLRLSGARRVAPLLSRARRLPSRGSPLPGSIQRAYCGSVRASRRPLSAGLAAGARPSASGILPAVAIVAGVVLRLAPVATVDFPLNDGGLFLQMIREVQGNGYALPSLSHYNGLAIPFAYPPLGFYVGALVSSMLRIDAIQVLHLVPPATAVLSLGAFALLARAAISAPAGAAVATLAFAAVPGCYVTMIMGGGLTRALGQLFAILALWAGLEFAHRARWLPWLGLVVFAAGAVLSHLEWGLFVGVGLLVLLLRRGRDPVAARGFLSSFVAIGVVTAPWWATMLARYGPGPFATASESGSWVTLLVSQRGDDSSIAFIAFAVAWGALCSVAVARGGAPWLLVGWIGLLALADFRAFGQLAAIPASVGLGCGASALAMAAEPIGARLGVRPAMRARFALERE